MAKAIYYDSLRIAPDFPNLSLHRTRFVSKSIKSDLDSPRRSFLPDILATVFRF